jgi:DNA (cytosine-5)-methyltransferase 1
MRKRWAIPVIDIFAGPGGLGEGFSACAGPRGERPFEIGLSIEKDPIAHQTLTLRSFFRQFPPGDAPDAYYHRLERRLTTAQLFDQFPQESDAAYVQARHAMLGDDASARLPDMAGVPRREISTEHVFL